MRASSTLRRRTPALVLGAVLVLGGCGGEDDSAVSAEFRDYCEVAQTNQEIFAGDGTGVALVGNLAALQAIADQAPDDLADEWQVFLGAVTGLRDAITAAGLSPGDFAAGVPTSTSSADKQRIAFAADRLAQVDVVEAANGIEQHAKDVCKFQLGL